jgi:LemA protein
VAAAVAAEVAEARGEEDMVRFLLILVLLLAVAVLIGFVAGYNKLRGADIRVAEALSGIDVELTRRAALIPSLVHIVGSFAAHEKAILDHVTDARAELTAATTGTSVTQRSAAERHLDDAVGQVLALGQSYPQLNSSSNFLDLQRNLTDTENKLAFARQYYNDAVATVNRLIATMPWMFVAPLAGVSEREFYQAPR